MLTADVQPISVDDHVVEPPNVFVDHVDPKYRDRAPRIVERDRAQGWLWEDRFYPMIFQGNAHTRPSQRWSPSQIRCSASRTSCIGVR